MTRKVYMVTLFPMLRLHVLLAVLLEDAKATNNTTKYLVTRKAYPIVYM